MKHVYIAGPMYGSGAVDDNVKAALKMAEAARDAGMMPFVPHLFMFWHFRHDHPDVDYWLDMDKAWLLKCDVLLVRGGISPGSTKEMEWAREALIPVCGVKNDLSDLGLALDEIQKVPEYDFKMRQKKLVRDVASEVLVTFPMALSGRLAQIEIAVQKALDKE